MDRAQFMQQLERLLSDISEAERQEALDYYESYFDDAGPENEAEVIRELGSPGKVAAIIQADLKESNDCYAEYSELGYEDIRSREPGQVPDKYTALTRTGQSRQESDSEAAGTNSREDAGNRNSGERRFGRDRARGRFEQAFTRAGKQMDQAFNKAGEQFDQAFSQAGESFEHAGEQFERARNRAGEEYERFSSRRKENSSRGERGYHAEKKKNHAGIILLLILLVFASPFIHGAAGGLLGVAITILLLPFLLVFGLGAAALGLIVGAVAMIVSGVVVCFGNPASGILTIGGGCLLMALGILLGIAAVWMVMKIIPVLIRKFTDFCQKILGRFRKEGDVV